MAEGRIVDARPKAAAVGCNRDEPPARRQHAPGFLEHGSGEIRILQAMDEHDPLDGGVRQRQVVLLDQRRDRGTLRRPVDDALAGRHEGEKAFGAVDVIGEERCREANAGQALAGDVRPQLADLARDETAGHAAERPGIEVP